MKKISLILTKVFSMLFIFLFILIPKVKAGENCKEYSTYRECTNIVQNHYYFFLRPYSQSDDFTIESSVKNYTLFSNYKEWEIPSSKEIELKTTCDEDEEDCWNLATFYCMWDALDNVGETNTIKPNYCTKDISDGINIYHAHGLQKEDNGEWKGGVSCNSESGSGILNKNQCLESMGNWNKLNYKKQACATIKTKNTLSRVKEDGTELQDGETDDETIIKIERTITEDTKVNDIQWGESFPVNGNYANCNNEIYPYKQIRSSESAVYSPVLYKVETTETVRQCLKNAQEDQGSCNKTTEVSSECGKQTIEVGNSRADITLNQKAYMTNILTPNEIYQGGGIKLGFIYYNTVSWNFADGEKIYGNKDDIAKQVKSNLKNANSVAENIKVDISFKTETGKTYRLDSSLIQKKCEQTGDFNPGKTVTTICTFFLPESVVEPGTGKVEYKNSIGDGINNQYYTPINYNGNLELNATISNISVLTGFNNWMNDWKLTYDGSQDKSCRITVNNRLYIYRPIDLNNPFPDRNAGVNWYEWYKKDSNKKRLQESYSKLQYQVTLDNQTVAKIKDYNTNHNYLEWDNIENGESDFIDTYFFTKRENLGDGS